MRPIRFRAWDKRRNRMIEVTSINFRDGTIQEDTRYAVNRELYFDQVKLMQYSRCIDTNGVDIYEGDRLLIESEEEPYKWKTYVKSDGLFSVEVCGYDYDWTPLQLLMEDNSITNVEVIGNRFENPELLEEEE